MIHSRRDIQYCEELFKSFYNIGATADGGVTRLGYTQTEDRMHETLIADGKQMGYMDVTDEVGNTYICNSMEENYYLIGSHLDSVVEGGRYDGVAGVIAGMMVLRWAKEDELKVPIRVGAFRCEESSNFGCCTIGSGLITKEAYKQDIEGLLSKDGKLLGDIFAERGLHIRPKKIEGVRQYLELHIEQGKVLKECHTQLGIVSTIAGPIRYSLYFHGMAEHSGTTPMMMRNDALCAAAEVILEVERIGQRESMYQSVATVGVLYNRPNAMNVIPGEVEIGIDIRGIDPASLDRIERGVLDSARAICRKRKVQLIEEKLSSIPPIEMTKDLALKLEKAARELQISNRVMVSGAGHDAMSFASVCDTAMVFIPCDKGISHNKMEFATIEDICNGARVIYEHIRRENQ
ncbi:MULTISPECIES: M20 family metallo-hydrolase [Lachnospiraceae]|jgi:hydantoinase/carbamoylase family amidase|uniref:M20 family metallo-hydrolase n=1 Tax=Faecalicatena acetigenes TaxID=2981790 RepID=A0ABT2TE88_9FIRM|nr:MULTISPECIES: M20 family metallo-hydrolase [Lachnospiraceae]MCU6748605.1 M20 family metallo-hydrolase [Faecalicatena acetigenes]SCI53408.1 Uncharacterized hydrolase HI_0588 [uncultured Clostridium sp.]